MKHIKGDLIMTEDMTFNEDLKVDGNIFGKNGERYDLKCWDLDCRNLNCRNLNCWDLDCGDLKCWNLNCWDLDCGDLKCWNLNCRDLNCWDLNCWDLNCLDLKAKKVSYYAVCFAYKNIECEEIQGRRFPCKEPFVLDGKITIKSKKKVCSECGREYEH